MAATIARLEMQVLQEYSQVARQLEEITAVVQKLSAVQPHLLNQVRPLERKLGLVLTLFKAAVWALVRKREDEEDLQYDQYESEQQR